VLTAELNALGDSENPLAERTALKLKPTTNMVPPVEVKKAAEPAKPADNKQPFKTRSD
jgi:hypothetical protein